MKSKSILELLYDITQEDTDIVIRFDKESKELKFRYYAVNERLDQTIKPKDVAEYKRSPNKLLAYVLEEIKSTILGANEEQNIGK